MRNLPITLPMGREEIREIIPHRPPFLFVDEIIELTPGERAVGNYRVSEDNCAGHFPGNPVMPGVLLIEAMNQVGAVALLSSPELAGQIPVFRRVVDAKFFKPVRPGDKLVIEVNKTNQRGPLGECQGRINVNDAVVAFATITFTLADSL